MSKRIYRRFTKEFELEPIKLAEEADRLITQLARELGIRGNQIYKWKKKLEEKSEDAFPGQGKQLGRDEEITWLKRELAKTKCKPPQISPRRD